ncbi:MAG: hypothetical protein ACKO45_00255 [Cyanobium sp.]
MRFNTKRLLLNGVGIAAIGSIGLASGNAQAAPCLLSNLASCNQTINDYVFSNFSFTGFTEAVLDNFTITSPSNAAYQVQLNFNLARTVATSGSFTYTVSLLNGRTFDSTQANITGNNGSFSTSLSSPGLATPSTASGGQGTTQNFGANLTSQTFTQSFSASPSNAGFFLNSVGAATSSTPPGTATTPGPLPLLGAGAAFGFSRKARRRIQAAS